MHRLPIQGHQLDQRDLYFQQIQVQTPYRQLNHAATSPHPQSNHLTVHNNSPQTLSATVDRRTIGNSTVSPPTFYRQKSLESSAHYNNRRHLETSDTIEVYPNRRNTLSPRSQSVCRASNLNISSFGASATSSTVLPVDSNQALAALPSSAELDATVTCLWILTPLTATVSAVIVLVAITTNQWLHTEEKMSNPSYNGTGDKDYLSKLTVSGLWKLCFTNPGEQHFECSKIDYFPKEEYAPDPNDSTMAIPYAVTKSSVFLLLATAVLFAGYVCCAIGHCARHRRIYTFTSGVLFIVSGLLMLIGLVMYISVFKAEVGSKLRQPPFMQPPIFTYRYGYSFILYVSGFMTIELAGTSAIFLFINWYQKDWLVKLTEKAFEKYSPGSESNISYTNLEQSSVYPCKRHPQAFTVQRTQPIGACEPSTSGTYISPSKQRRFFFDKDSMSPISPSCSLHRNKNVYVSSSLRDVSSNRYEFPPPPPVDDSSFGEPYSIDYPEAARSANTVPYRNESSFLVNVGSTKSLHLVGANTMPRDATTNTISTTADIVNPNDDFGYNDGAMGPVFDDFSPSVQHDRDFVTFDLDRPMELRPAASVGIGLQTIRKDFGSGADTLRRTTPV